MPELPEVETTLRGIVPHVQGHTVHHVIIRNTQLRWPIPKKLVSVIKGQLVQSISRRAKYLLFKTPVGTLIMHLGMSGSLRIVTKDTPAQKHDHFDLVFTQGHCLRLRDPRKFGAILWTTKPVAQHKLLRHLGPEPLSDEFNANYLYTHSRKRKLTIKQFIMDSKIVVGVGNIYASETLFLAQIHPARSAGRISKQRYAQLVEAVKSVLTAAIKQGGTTLRDFTASDGRPGYFTQQLAVYNRKGKPCIHCNAPIQHIVLGQRSTFYCKHCQH